MSKPTYFIQPYRKRSGRWSFRVRSVNGKVIGHDYNSRRNMLASARALARATGLAIRERR